MKRALVLGLVLVLGPACAPAVGSRDDAHPSREPVRSSVVTIAPPTTAVPASVSATTAPSRPPMDPEGKTITWASYRSDKLGLEFQYPASSSVYGPLPGCAPSESPGGIVLDQLGISAEISTSTAQEAAGAFIRRNEGLAVESRRTTTIGGNPAEVLALRSIVGGIAQQGRYAESWLVANRGRVYTFFWIAGSFTCVAAPGWLAPTTYAQVIQTFHFRN